MAREILGHFELRRCDSLGNACLDNAGQKCAAVGEAAEGEAEK